MTLSVHDLVEFVFKRGDLRSTDRFFSPARALEGTRGHQRIQKARPSGYQSEIPVAYDIERERLSLRIRGRIDGVLPADKGVVIEEIKTLTEGADAAVPDPLHWAQGKLYAFLYGRYKGAETVEVRLTYLHLTSDEVEIYSETFDWETLAGFFEEAVAFYLRWAERQAEWWHRRDAAIQRLAFPFGEYRPGQRRLAISVYRAAVDQENRFIEAPTGTGKTLGVLFPAIKAFQELSLEKLFYLTAKTVGRQIAEKTLDDLRAVGLHLRAVTLTARERVCIREGQPCDITSCPLTIGYYDRFHNALDQALQHEALTRTTLNEIGERHQVCPFALALDVSEWADLIIGDYNHVFDPQASLKRYFSEGSGDHYLFLIDEAHNLADRAREMFSATLDLESVEQARKAVGHEQPRCRQALGRVAQTLKSYHAYQADQQDPTVSKTLSRTDAEGWSSKNLPQALLPPLRKLASEAEATLAQNQIRDPDCREALLEIYFRAAQFLRIAEGFNDDYVTLFKQTPRGGRLKLFCLNPASKMERLLKRARATIFFSATLTPAKYYQALLDGQAEASFLRLSSPFPTEHLKVIIAEEIPTHYKARASSIKPVSDSIAAVSFQKPGNYLAFFPSYHYMTEVWRQFTADYPDVGNCIQTPGMAERDREAFLEPFATPRDHVLIGFVVMGGLFGEGIDLVGDRLIGAIVVGVGLPQITWERELIRRHFDRLHGNGFEFAYTNPGWNRVLQSAGRVIRSETDRGIILLIDERFRQPRYQSLFPPWWATTHTRDPTTISEEARRFWKRVSP